MKKGEFKRMYRQARILKNAVFESKSGRSNKHIKSQEDAYDEVWYIIYDLIKKSYPEFVFNAVFHSEINFVYPMIKNKWAGKVNTKAFNRKSVSKNQATLIG